MLHLRSVYPYFQAGVVLCLAVCLAISLGTEAASYLLYMLVLLNVYGGIIASRKEKAKPSNVRPIQVIAFLIILAMVVILIHVFEPRRDYIVIPSLIIVAGVSCYVLGKLLRPSDSVRD